MVVLAVPGETLTEQHIPGRVLRGKIEGAVLGEAAGRKLDGPLDYHGTIDKASSVMIAEALERTSGNISKAAKMLGLSENGLAKAMKRLGIQAKKP
jgi:DNA-binding NtrC family response regulator